MTELRFESRLSEIQMSSCLVSLLGWSHGDVQQSPWGSAGPSREFTGRRVKACPWTQSVGHSGFALFPSTFSFQVRAHLLEHRAARRKLKTVAPTSWITDSVEVMSLCEHLYCPFFISILSLIWSRRVVKYYFQLVKDSNHCILPLYENTSYAYPSEEVFMGFLRAPNSKHLCRNKWILTQMDTISFSNDY